MHPHLPTPHTITYTNPPAAPTTGQEVFYYQGLHDVASVLLLVTGAERPAFPLLARLVSGHLRDATRSGLDGVLEALGLMYPILGSCDPQLVEHLQSAGLAPFFALSWLITWFAHDVKNLQVGFMARAGIETCNKYMQKTSKKQRQGISRVAWQ